MNKIISTAAVILFLAGYGCSMSEIPTYEDLTSDRYAYFYLREIDSIETSFFFFPGQDEINYPIVVRCSGVGLKDEIFKLGVVEARTTAPSNTYAIPQNPVMRAGLGMDTCWITLKKTDLLNTTKVRLVIEVQDSEDFLAGRTDYRRMIFWFHNIIAKPTWWDANCVSLYLGDYSDKKYQLFLDVIGVDLTGTTDSERRHYALLFKQYLTREKTAGRTVYEVDGKEMVVAVLGNLV